MGAGKTAPVIDNVYEVTVPRRVVAIVNRDIHGRVVRASAWRLTLLWPFCPDTLQQTR